MRVIDGHRSGRHHQRVWTKRRCWTKSPFTSASRFNVPDGVMRMDMPWAVVRPSTDQLPGACKNYFTVGRWVDVSNDDFGVTWATLDAPLIEVGADHGRRPPNLFEPETGSSSLEPTQTFYSYVMNNYWETNYKASQEGMTTFRYSIMPHRQFDQAARRPVRHRAQPAAGGRPGRRERPVPDSRCR